MVAKKMSAKSTKSAKPAKSVKGAKGAEGAESAKPAKDAAETKKAPAGALAAAFAFARSILGGSDEDVTVEEREGVAKFTCRGVHYATLRADNNELVVMLLQPKDTSELSAKLAHYKETNKGWLEWRTVASRSPTPWLQAGVGDMVGQLLYEILHGRTAAPASAAPAKKPAPAAPAKKPAKKPASGARRMTGPLTSAGGPYIVVPEAVSSAWQGAGDKAAYEAVCRGPDEGRVARLEDRDILVLGTPDPLYVAPVADGSVFARVMAFDADDDALLAEMLQNLPTDGWESIGKLAVVESPLIAFDSAIPGDDAGNDVLRIELAPGSYAVTSKTFRPDGGTVLLLTRLQRR